MSVLYSVDETSKEKTQTSFFLALVKRVKREQRESRSKQGLKDALQPLTASVLSLSISLVKDNRSMNAIREADPPFTALAVFGALILLNMAGKVRSFSHVEVDDKPLSCP